MKELCVDISSWQGGINYQDIKNNCKYAILRAGFGDSDIDSRFEEHYANLHGGDMHLGAYWYSYAQSPDQARTEARLFLSIINGKEFDLPIYLDIEDGSMAGLGRGTLDAIVRAFGEEIQNAGYYFGVYSNLNWYRNIISGSELNKSFDWWIALWDSEAPDPAYGINYGIWQFGYVNLGGMTIDGNYIYKDYPQIIRDLGLNHLTPTKKSKIQINGHVENIGWTGWKNSGEIVGTTGQSLRLEAIKIKLLDEDYEVYAQGHLQDIGWKDYGKVDENTVIGSTGESRRLEALILKIINKKTKEVVARYQGHIQEYGWSAPTNCDGKSSIGSTGQSLRLEAVKIEEL